MAQVGAATSTPLIVQARPMGDMVQLGVVAVSFGILLLISIPGLIWLRQKLFRDDEPDHSAH